MAKSGRGPTLTLDAIVDQSIRIIRAEGVPGLTMRAVAAGLGVTPMAVYYYVSDKDELMGHIVERVTRSIGVLRFDPEEDWRETLRSSLMSVWEQLRRYPGLSSYIIDQPALGVTPERLESGIAFFERVGFAGDEAPLAWAFAVTYIHGRISVNARLGGRADAPHLGRLKTHDYVAFGVEAVIAGLEAMLEARGARGEVRQLARSGNGRRSSEG